MLLKRKDRQSREPVKGGLEPNESPERGIYRELLEETGLTADNIIYFLPLEHIQHKATGKDGMYDFFMYAFLMHVSGEKPFITINFSSLGGEDHEDYGRFSKKDIDTIPLDIYTSQIVQKMINL